TAKSFTKPPGSQSNVVAPPDPPLMAATFYGKGKKGFGKGASKGRSGKPFFPYGKEGNVGRSVLRLNHQGRASIVPQFQLGDGTKMARPGHLQRNCPSSGVAAALWEEQEES
ncbi:hypothetical protein FOZ63_019374, partial [Perkinsus olseni]